MSVTGKTLNDVLQSYPTLQDGDLMFVERGGVGGKQTYAQLRADLATRTYPTWNVGTFTVSGASTFTGAATFNGNLTFGAPTQARVAMGAMPNIQAASGIGQILSLDAANGAALSLPGSSGQTYAYWFIPQTVSGGALGTSVVGVAAGATVLNAGTSGIILRGFCIRLS